MIDWIYEDEIITELPPVFGFVYRLTYDSVDGPKYYIGRKQVKKKTTLPALKNGSIRPNAERIGKNKNGKRVYFDVIYKDSDWLDYEGSFETDLKLVKKEILTICLTKTQLTYTEIEYQFKYNVLRDNHYLNRNINNMFFRNKI